MSFLYSLGIRGLQLLMWLAAFFHPKAKKWVHGRRVKLSNFPVPKDAEVVWFHCASLGEFDQGLPVMNDYKERFPTHFLLVTFFSPSGMEFYNKRDHKVDLALYLPIDTKAKAREFVAHFHPKKVFFVKYEFWYRHLKAAKKSGAKIYGVSSLFRPTHRFFKAYGGFFRKALQLFDHFFTQDARSLDLLASIGITQATITGDTRYDRMLAVKAKGEVNSTLEQFVREERMLLLGSSWTIDEETLLPSLLKLQENFKIVIAPHDISESHIAAISSLFEDKVQRYTTYQNGTERILILDTIGQLTNAYQYASLAYVGGGFTGKLHNILEPAAFGIPVIFGPKFERFPEAQLFLDQQVAFSVATAPEFEAAVAESTKRQTEIHSALQLIFEQNKGAAKKVVDAVSLALEIRA